MVSITCPWCDEDALIAFVLLEEPDATFSCPDCGTSVAIEDEAITGLDQAA